MLCSYSAQPSIVCIFVVCHYSLISIHSHTCKPIFSFSCRPTPVDSRYLKPLLFLIFVRSSLARRVQPYLVLKCLCGSTLQNLLTPVLLFFHFFSYGRPQGIRLSSSCCARIMFVYTGPACPASRVSFFWWDIPTYDPRSCLRVSVW